MAAYTSPSTYTSANTHDSREWNVTYLPRRLRGALRRHSLQHTNSVRQLSTFCHALQSCRAQRCATLLRTLHLMTQRLRQWAALLLDTLQFQITNRNKFRCTYPRRVKREHRLFGSLSTFCIYRPPSSASNTRWDTLQSSGASPQRRSGNSDWPP